MAKNPDLLDPELKRRLTDLQKKINKERLSAFSRQGSRRPRTFQTSKVSYNLASFESEKLNYALNTIISVITDVRKDFSDAFVSRKSARSLGTVKKVRERTTDIFEPLRRQASEYNESSTNGGPDIEGFKDSVRRAKREFSKWFSDEIVHLSEDEDDTELSINAFHELFQSCNIVYQEVDEIIVVDEEMERFVASYHDNRKIRFGKFLKRQRYRLRRLFGSDYVPKRTIHMRNLVKYNFGGILPQRFRKAANMVGYETFFLITKLKMLHRNVDQFFHELLDFLDKQKSEGSGDFDRKNLGNLIDFHKNEFDEDLKFVRSEVEKYRDDTNTEINAAFARVYNSLIEMIQICGTFELPEKKFRFSAVYEDSEKAKGEIFSTLRTWNDYSSGLAGSYAVDLELIELQSKIRSLVDDALIELSDTIERNLSDQLQRTESLAREILEKVQSLCESESEAEKITRQLDKEKNKIVDYIKNDLLIRLEEVSNNETLTKVIDNLLYEFSNLTDEMADSYHVLDSREFDVDEGVTPHPVQLKQIPLRQVTKSYFEIEANRDLNDINRLIFEETNAIANSMIDVWRMINFNTESGIKEIEGFIGEKRIPGEQLGICREVVTGGLDQSVTKLEEALDQVGQLESSTRERVIDVVAQKSRNLKALIAEKTVHEIREHVKQRVMEAEKKRVFHKLREKLSGIGSIFRKTIRKALETIEVDVVLDIKTRLGFRKVSQIEILETYDRVKIDEDVVENLPFIYRRLFHIESSEAGEFLVGRDDEINLVRQAKDRWKKGLYAATVTVGESGGGKTSFMNYMEKNLFSNEKLIRHKFLRTVTGKNDLLATMARLFNVSRVASFEELQNRLLKSAEKTAVILESTQNLYIRDIGGFDALREFLVFVEATGKQIFWNLSMNQHAWHYLDSVMNISEFFSYVVEVKNLSREDLEKAILSRHKLSGFGLDFSASAEIRDKKGYRKARTEQERQQFLKDLYFGQLYESSRGNAQAALYYWVKSIRGFDNDTIHINPFPELNFRFLKDFHFDKLFTLKALIQHGGLTIREHSRIFKLDPVESKRILSYLQNANLIVASKKMYREDNFVINKSVYIPIAEELRARNLLK